MTAEGSPTAVPGFAGAGAGVDQLGSVVSDIEASMGYWATAATAPSPGASTMTGSGWCRATPTSPGWPATTTTFTQDHDRGLGGEGIGQGVQRPPGPVRTLPIESHTPVSQFIRQLCGPAFSPAGAPVSSSHASSRWSPSASTR